MRLYQKSVTSSPRSTPAISSSRRSSPPPEEQVARVAAEGLLPDRVAGRTRRPASAALRRSWASPTVTPARTRSTRRFGVPSASYGRPSDRGSVPSSQRSMPLVELLLAEVDEAGALGVGLAVEPEPGREQQHGGHRPAARAPPRRCRGRARSGRRRRGPWRPRPRRPGGRRGRRAASRCIWP